MTDWRRRLPRSNAPHPDESLAGYLLNLAYRLDLPPHELIRRTGVKPAGRISLLDLTYATRIPPDIRHRFATATGLTDTEVVSLTTERFGELLHMGRPGKNVARSEYGNQWLTPGRSRLCPDCLRELGPARALWRVHWLTAWTVACTRHNRLLIDTCPGCKTPVGEPGEKGFRSLIPLATLPGIHPAACRAWKGPKRVCETRLDQLDAPTADPALLDLQQRLDNVLAGNAANQRSVGVPVDSGQWLRDLRLSAILMQVARDNTPFEGIPYGDAATAFIRSRIPNNGREVKGTHITTQPPEDTAAAAGLLLTADRLLGRDGQAELLNDLAQAAASREPLMWASIQNRTQASDGLRETFIRHKKALTRPSRIRAYSNGRLFTFHPAHVPAYLDVDTFHRHFADVRGPSNASTRSRYERPVRRYVPIALVMLVTGFDTTAAGTLLGYDKSRIFAGTARASEAFRDLGEPELLRRIAAIAAELEAAPASTGKVDGGGSSPIGPSPNTIGPNCNKRCRARTRLGRSGKSRSPLGYGHWLPAGTSRTPP